MTNIEDAKAPLHPSDHARVTPDKPAYIMEPSGIVVTYRELDACANQIAHMFRAMGLNAGDSLVLLLENHKSYYELIWAAQRSGLRYICISSKLTANEIEYIFKNSDAKMLVTSSVIGNAKALPKLLPGVILFNIGESRDGFRNYDVELEPFPTTPILDQSAGVDMLYSSGTTGVPKGIRREFPKVPFSHPDTTLCLKWQQTQFGFGPDEVYLCPGPIYHAAPLHWNAGIMALGGTVIIMEKFDPELTLKLIEKHSVTACQFVPTHFVRMLKLPAEVRTKYDLASIKTVIHAGAPCPVDTKHSMMDWFGPTLYEYYGGTEGVGVTFIGPKEWLKKPGSVGKAFVGDLKICGSDGAPLPYGNTGDVYFANGPKFSYFKDAEKTLAAVNKHGWATLGDVGYLDKDGYLFLVDRKNYMIISGGVNIYPQEIENVLIQHAAVEDVAIVGAPDSDMGEKVVAVIQTVPGINENDELKSELINYVRKSISHVKCPRQIDFVALLPRTDSGKLLKRLVRNEYWGKKT